VFLEVLATTSGRTRLGIIQTIAKRRTASAVPALAALLAGQDAETAAAATIALGQIGGREALAALRSVSAVNATTIEAKLAVARQLPAAEAMPLFMEVADNPQLAPHQRAAALRGMIESEPASAATRIDRALAGSEWKLKQAAIESILSAAAADVVPTLAAKLPTYDAPTEASVLAAFGRRPERSAVAATIAATSHADASVRAAAIETLGRLPGDREMASVLAKFASGPDADAAKLAMQSLARLDGPGVSAAILAGAQAGESAGRTVLIAQLALRNQTEALPFLRACRNESDAGVRAAAIAALGDIAPSTDQRLALEWAAAATDSTEQTRAIRAVLNLTLRNPDAAKRAQPVYQFIEQAEVPAAIRLLPLLQRLGGRESADTVARLGIRDNAALAAAATTTLTRWSDASALPALATLATKSAAASTREAAAKAALAYFDGHREPWTATESAVVSQLLGATSDSGVRARLVNLLNRAADAEALALAEKLRGDPTLGAAATEAAQSIAANRAGAPRSRASDNERGLANIFDGKATTYWRTAATAGTWIEVDYLQSRPVHQLTIEHFGRTNEFPVRYEVFVTDNPSKPGPVRAAGPGQRSATVVDLPAGTRGRYVIIKYPTERKEAYWTISELYVN
jgi:HEAT repeat protein